MRTFTGFCGVFSIVVGSCAYCQELAVSNDTGRPVEVFLISNNTGKLLGATTSGNEKFIKFAMESTDSTTVWVRVRESETTYSDYVSRNHYPSFFNPKSDDAGEAFYFDNTSQWQFRGDRWVKAELTDGPRYRIPRMVDEENGVVTLALKKYPLPEPIPPEPNPPKPTPKPDPKPDQE